LTVARALHRNGVEVQVLTSPEYSYVAASRGVDGIVLPEPLREPEPWYDALCELAATGGGVVLSGSDSASEWLTQHRAALPSNLRSFESLDGVHAELMDKLALYRMASGIGIRVPEFQHVRDRGDLLALLP
jgi:hypothetical protein